MLVGRIIYKICVSQNTAIFRQWSFTQKGNMFPPNVGHFHAYKNSKKRSKETDIQVVMVVVVVVVSSSVFLRNVVSLKMTVTRSKHAAVLVT